MGRGRDYDGSAFPFFALTLMSLYIIPSTWYAPRRHIPAGGRSASLPLHACYKLTHGSDAARPQVLRAAPGLGVLQPQRRGVARGAEARAVRGGARQAEAAGEEVLRVARGDELRVCAQPARAQRAALLRRQPHRSSSRASVSERLLHPACCTPQRWESGSHVRPAALDCSGSIKSWDPYEVLGIETGASGAQIKRAYRQMSLKYHPDKNPDDPEAAEKFLGVTRAHSVLTDEAARENYERYGNPEGRQAMEVAIGLPEILATEQGRKTMLVIYLGVLIIGMPLFVWTWYSRSQKYSASGLLNETEANIRRRYYLYRARGHKFPSEPPVVKVEEVPQEISCAKEFESPSSLQLRPADALQQLQKKLAQDGVPGAELSRRFTGSTKKVKKVRMQRALSLKVHLLTRHVSIANSCAGTRTSAAPVGCATDVRACRVDELPGVCPLGRRPRARLVGTSSQEGCERCFGRRPCIVCITCCAADSHYGQSGVGHLAHVRLGRRLARHSERIRHP